MTLDALDLVDATCSVCGAEVRGEKVIWEDYVEQRIDKELWQRVFQATFAKMGGHVCRKCGTALCCKEHKKDVDNVGLMRGYMKSPCPTCGEPLLKSFILAEPPEGTVFPAKAGSATAGGAAAGGATDSVEHSEAGSDSVAEPTYTIDWQRKAIEDGSAVFDCPHCDWQHRLPIAVFKDPPGDGVEGFTGKDDFVTQGGLANLLALVVGIAVFILVHRAMFGAELVIGWALIAPALVAVVSHTVSRLLFGSIPILRGAKIPVYGHACSKCAEEMVFATDGSQLALQIRKEDT